MFFIGLIYEGITGEDAFDSFPPVDSAEIWIALLSSGIVGGWLLGKTYLDYNSIDFDPKDYPLLSEDEMTDD